MKKLFFLLFVLVFVACKDKENEFENLPACIQEAIENSSEDIKRVQTQTIDGEVHYWLNTDAIQVDGKEDIVNESCKELCSFGGLLPSDCSDNYNNDDWVIIWEE